MVDDNSIPPEQRALASRLYARIPEKARDDYLRHLDHYMPRLWLIPAFLRRRYHFARSQAALRNLREKGVPSFEATYQRNIIAVAGLGANLPGGGALLDAAGRVHHGTGVPPVIAEMNAREMGLILEQAGLCRPGRSRPAGNLRLLLAHMFLSPDELRKASEIPEPFPWPWHLEGLIEDGVLDVEFNLHLIPHPDISDALRTAAGRMQRTLDDEYRGAPAMPYGASPEAQQAQDKKYKARLAAGEIAHRWFEQGKTDVQIAQCGEFQDAVGEIRSARGKRKRIDTEDGVRELRRWYRKEKGLDAPPRGKRPKR